MGMYTQGRGFLCCASISCHTMEDFYKYELEKIQKEFRQKYEKELRSWVCYDTYVKGGANGSVWIFFGTELKNYGNEIETWIEFLVKRIDCEGRIEFQYEENGEGQKEKVWLIQSGGVIQEKEYTLHTYGYGFNPSHIKEQRRLIEEEKGVKNG